MKNIKELSTKCLESYFKNLFIEIPSIKKAISKKEFEILQNTYFIVSPIYREHLKKYKEELKELEKRLKEQEANFKAFQLELANRPDSAWRVFHEKTREALNLPKLKGERKIWKIKDLKKDKKIKLENKTYKIIRSEFDEEFNEMRTTLKNTESRHIRFENFLLA